MTLTAERTPRIDVAIVGGGVTGLWVHAVLRQAGYNSHLFEAQELGSGQTLASQGILHGGTKYALTGKLTGSSESVKAMPERWTQHINGKQQPALNLSVIQAEHQWMWDKGGLGSRITNFFASKAMASRVKKLAAHERPDWLSDRQIYQLQEPVLDVRSVVELLASPFQDTIYRAKVSEIELGKANSVLRLNTDQGEQTIHAQLVIHAAGEGNEAISAMPMQRRGLHMVMVKGDLPPVWGHIIDAQVNPVVTITSHEMNGQRVWYLGGQLAEDGAVKDSVAQIDTAKALLSALVPGIAWPDMQWSSFKIDRAEGSQPDGGRPDEPVIRQVESAITVWPTKLVFAPLVADEILKRCQSIEEMDKDMNAALSLPKAQPGCYPWETANWS